jgi:hypothetical protein
MSEAEIHIGGHQVWSGETRVEADPVRPGRALVRTEGKVDLAVTIGYAYGEKSVSLFANGRRVSIEKGRSEYEERSGRRFAIAQLTVDVGSLAVADPDALAPILSRAEFGTAALEALLAALPPCIRCMAEQMAKPGEEWPAPGVATGKSPDGNVVCWSHGVAGTTELSYAPVVRTIQRRLAEPSLRGYGPGENTRR